MKVLVSGSSGLIGGALIERLLAEGHGVTRLVRSSGSGSAGGRTGITDVAWDPDHGSIDSSGLDAAGPFDGVVHLAGAGIGDKRWNPARKQVILESRTRSTTLLATTLTTLQSPPPVLVSASAVGYYGDGGATELTEDSPAGSGFLADVCTAWEAAASPAVEAGIRTVLLRTGIVLSAHGGAFGKQLPLFRFGLGGRMGSGAQFRSWITLDDEISVILHCLEDAGLSGPVNSTAPIPATDGELAKALGHVLHRPTVLAVPAPALNVVLGAEMADQLVLIGQRVVPAALIARGFTFAHTDLLEAVSSVLTPAS
jgi:uncharacterized protein (TIGR01777 family)